MERSGVLQFKHEQTRDQPQGLEQPFYGTLRTWPDAVAYLDKVFRLGFDGIWHDDYGEFEARVGTRLTPSTIEPRSCTRRSFLAVHRRITGTDRLPLEMKLKDIVEARGGFMTCNGAPLTRTEILRAFGQHDAENGMEQVSQHVQLYTPVMLNRPPGGCADPDPLYFRNTSTMETGLCKYCTTATHSFGCLYSAAQMSLTSAVHCHVMLQTILRKVARLHVGIF